MAQGERASFPGTIGFGDPVESSSNNELPGGIISVIKRMTALTSVGNAGGAGDNYTEVMDTTGLVLAVGRFIKITCVFPNIQKSGIGEVKARVTAGGGTNGIGTVFHRDYITGAVDPKDSGMGAVVYDTTTGTDVAFTCQILSLANTVDLAVISSTDGDYDATNQHGEFSALMIVEDCGPSFTLA